MSGPAFWPGDPVSGTNRYTDEYVVGTLVSYETSDMDGKVYATVKIRPDEFGLTERTMLLRDLRGPRACYRATPNLDKHGYAPRGADSVTCSNCGRVLYGYPSVDADWGTSWTHRWDRVPARFR